MRYLRGETDRMDTLSEKPLGNRFRRRKTVDPFPAVSPPPQIYFRAMSGEVGKDVGTRTFHSALFITAHNRTRLEWSDTLWGDAAMEHYITDLKIAF